MLVDLHLKRCSVVTLAVAGAVIVNGLVVRSSAGDGATPAEPARTKPLSVRVSMEKQAIGRLGGEGLTADLFVFDDSTSEVHLAIRNTGGRTLLWADAELAIEGSEAKVSLALSNIGPSTTYLYRLPKGKDFVAEFRRLQSAKKSWTVELNVKRLTAQ